MEYGNPVWNTCLKKHIFLIEQVQRKFTKFIHCFRDCSYEDRLLKLKLPSLEYRRYRGDMLQVYKITHNHYDHTSVKNLLTFNTDNRLRGHNFKITKPQTTKQQFANYFSNRVINNWNSLPSKIVNAETINQFKNLFDSYNVSTMYKTNIFLCTRYLVLTLTFICILKLLKYISS